MPIRNTLPETVPDEKELFLHELCDQFISQPSGQNKYWQCMFLPKMDMLKHYISLYQIQAQNDWEPGSVATYMAGNCLDVLVKSIQFLMLLTRLEVSQ